MKIEEAQEGNGKAWLPSDKTSIKGEYVICVGGIMSWYEGIGAAPMNPVAYCLLKRDDWEPYHEEKEIRPEKKGELWRDKHDDIWFTYEITNEKLGIFNGGYKPQDDDEFMIHNKNGWTRLFPKPEDESIERMVFENVTFRSKNGCIVAMNECGAMIGMLDEPPMKMTLEMTKNCEHGKGLNDYCEPCGRVNGG